MQGATVFARNGQWPCLLVRKTHCHRPERPKTVAPGAKDNAGPIFPTAVGYPIGSVMKIISLAKEMQEWSLERRSRGGRIGFIPTMGYLHEAHLALMREAKKKSDLLVTSIFVNPKQFNNPSDLEFYPRDEEGDLSKCREEGCDVVFYPRTEEMYPDDFSLSFKIAGLADTLCGVTRPGHLQGVALVVAKLFNIILPHVTVFGQKDYQQLAVVRQMVKDLSFPIDVIGHPTVREDDGLAMSSRNARLGSGERIQAAVLFQALFEAKEAYDNGERNPSALIANAKRKIEAAGPCEVVYIDIVDARSLQILEALDRPAVMALSVEIGQVRLIDNVLLD